MEFNTAAERARRPQRKYTYAKCKEERQRLDEQVGVLSKRVSTLRRNRHDATALSVVAERVHQNAAMRGAIQSHTQMLMGAHGLLTSWMSEQVESPLASYIHLTSDSSERKRTLMAMRPQKLADGERFLRLQCEHLDPLRPFTSESRFENAQGDQCATKIQVLQLDGVTSVKQVFEAVLFSIANIEIAVSEKLGHLTLREDYDSLDDGTFNTRLLSSDAQGGVRHEVNAVTFTQLRAEQYASGCELPGCGLIVADFVDQDELYPYRPDENLRRDISIVCRMTPHRRPKAKRDTASPEEEFVVVLQAIINEKVHHSELQLDPSALRALRNAMSRWGDIVVDSIYDRLAATKSGKDRCGSVDVVE